MANLGGTSSLTRTRSTRLTPNLVKPVQNSSRTGTPGIISSASVAPQLAVSPTGVSNVSLFLTNLRLLDLDLHPDWPGINGLTFTAKDAAQGQKKRIQCVEWALYHLFTLWDPEEARNKLRPFFPPLDQVQSLNLRAALLRGLEQAKKNGVLGRDAVVRKTMLDECKGERLEEVLAAFSSAVLKKLVAEQQLNEPAYPTPAQTLALENRGYSGERSELTALILAHRVSLRRTLDDKNAARLRFREFADVLALKEKALTRRREDAEAARRNGPGQGVSDHQKLEVWRTVRNNWTGNDRWMETLLYGDSRSRKDGLLSAPFDRVWRRVQSGRLAEFEEEKSSGLLEQLEDKVRGQQERLKKWQGFRQRMFGKNGSESATKEPAPPSERKGIDLGFRAHENLHIGRMSPRKLPRSRSGQLDSHYEALITGLKAELASTGSDVPRIPPFFQRPPQADRPVRRTSFADSEPEIVSDISDLDEEPVLSRPSPARREPIRVLEEPAFEPVLRKAMTFDDDHPYPDGEQEHTTPSRFRRSATIQSHSPSSRRRPIQESPIRTPERRLSSPPKPKQQPASRQLARSPPRLVTSPSPEPPPSPEHPPLSPTQQLADQILASVSAASPSPAKKPRRPLSLAERTRLSMARRTSHANLRVPADEDADHEDDDDDDVHPPNGHANNGDDEEPDPLAIKRASVAAGTPAHDGAEGGGYEDLVSRTRRSMAGFEAARQKAQLERRRSLRRGKQPAAGAASSSSSSAAAAAGNRASGYFPAVSEEEDGNHGNTTLLLAEELMTGDDYEAVFMSRPKIKTSPVGTPVRGVWD
ncbi:HAUS augmin-like complex subunit 6 N-terminus-domain-containing protein [Madurella fahalii]|uniref:HAUS augmin-like complex subunit 6 N-terminus-domain-containing protein n=1 Tax=Madurella fahalii TaxID=1157608 RepID=A0ABQ0GNA2_9PEZI